MKIFISWSGVPSRHLAEAFHWWLPKVLQGIVPFVSAKDIDKGATWASTLASELTDTNFGVICLTQENLTSPWLNYEAGALSKAIDARVCPVLLGIEKSGVPSPLSQLQLTSIDRDDISLMMRSINKSAGQPLSDGDLDEAVNMWWPRLESMVAAIDLPAPSLALTVTEPARPEVSQDDKTQEILDVVRAMDRRLHRLENRPTSRPNGATRASFAPWDEKLMDELEAAGLRIHAWRLTDKDVFIECKHLPTPLPGASYDVLSRYAVEWKRSIRLQGSDGDRVVEFNSRGHSSEPPF